MTKQQTAIYPQAFPMTHEEVASFLGQPLIAKLCTHNADGTIHIVPIWFRYEDGEIFFGSQEITRKVRNIKRNSQVTVLVDTTEPELKGVIMCGNAELIYDDVIPRRISIFEKYMDSDSASELAEKLAGLWKPIVICVKLRQVISFDYSKGFGLNLNPDAETVKIF